MNTVRPTPDFTSAGRVRYNVTAWGLTAASLERFAALSGTFQLNDSDSLFDSSDNAEKVGPFISGTLRPIGRNACQVTQIYRGAVVTQAWEFADEDATVTVSVLNKSLRTIRYPAFGDLTARWPSTPTGITTGPWWNHWYTQYCGRTILSPSYWLRLRCSYLADDKIGVGVCPLGLGDERNLILWQPTGDDEGYTQRWFRVIYDRPIPSGESRTFRLTLRVSDTTDWRHLLQPYRDNQPPALWTPSSDRRPIVQDGVHFGQSLVRPDNPHGYNDSGGADLSRRLDRPESVTLWKGILDRAKAFGCRGVLWWQPGGYVKGLPQYHIDSHCVPADVLPQYIEVNRYAASIGLECGSLLRPAELGYRLRDGADGGMGFGVLTDDVKRLLAHRLECQRNEQFAGRMFYLDSFGLFGGPDVQWNPWLKTRSCPDAEVAAWLRQQVGPEVPLYCEACSDLMARYCGAYAYSPDGVSWLTYGKQLDVLQWLRPGLPVFGVDASWGPLPERLRWAEERGVTAVVLDYEVPASS